MSGHRSHLKQKNKSHKSGHAQKNPFKQVKANLPGAKVAEEKGQKNRRIQSTEAKKLSKIESLQMTKKIGTKTGPPKIFGVLPCSDNANPEEFIDMLPFEKFEDEFITPADGQSRMISSGILSYPAGEKPQFIHKVVPLAFSNIEDNRLSSVLDIGGIVDVVVLLFISGEPLNEAATNDIKILKSMGMPTTMAVVLSPNGQPIAKSLINEYKKYTQADIPDLTRVLPIANDQDIGQFIRFLEVTSPRNISWKENRPSMLIQNFIVNQEAKRVTIQGYLRNAPLSVNQIITIPNVGDFQIQSANNIIPNMGQRHPFIYTQNEPIDEINEEIHPPQTIEVPLPIGPLQVMDSQNVPNPQHNPEEEDNEEEEDNYEPNQDITQDLNEDDKDDQIEPSVWMRSEEDLVFPNEIQYDNNVLLHQKLHSYKALKSFTKCNWNPNENLPPHYARLFEFPAFSRTSEAAIAEQLEGEIMPGEKVTAILISDSETDSFLAVPSNRFISMFGLLRHETRFTVLNCTIKNVGEPLISKHEDLLMVCGFRHMWVRPLYSEDTRCDKHKLIKKLGTGESAIATFVSPAVMSIHSSPVTYFRATEDGIIYTGSGSIKTVDPSRLVIREAILTGNPYRATGKTARVSMMFFNKLDIEYFRSVSLFTKNKSHGHITEAVGTKGHFKALFNRIVDQADTVCMSLYKRVYPPLVDEETEDSKGRIITPTPTPAHF